MKHLMHSAAVLAFSAPAVLADATIPQGFESARMTSAEVNLHYVRDGGPGETVILMHGWPQTWASWVEVMPLLSADYDVIAVDLRGVGQSDKPEGGYDKTTMATDIMALMDELDISSANIVGHDIGGMTAFAFASQFPEATTTVTIIDVPIPGTPTFDAISVDPRAWHFAFHAAQGNIPEVLTAGREAFYYGAFLQKFDAGAGGITETEIAITVDAYSDPQTAAAGFNWYRAFAQDAEDNKAFMETRLEMPVLGLNAGRLSPVPYVRDMLAPLATTVEGRAFDSGHWIAETRPEELSATLDDFFKRH
ncbi:alpha/beta hydrolase [uncultured Tateyamaria sp.]|uniref:alpha/beta fold hydrolase n=1 Tax=uncultured Tateyamaria sp. TaxID=455651 RepID=UPI0026162192|nr:alpha/beta hydrolase [uncultured Tateyamaria sp.]